jgi:hypothetical protein
MLRSTVHRLGMIVDPRGPGELAQRLNLEPNNLTGTKRSLTGPNKASGRAGG